MEALDKDKIGLRIVALRLHRQIKQKALAAKLGYGDATALWKVEAGKTLPSLEKLQRLKAALGASMDWLINGGPDGPIPDPCGNHSQVHINIVLLARKVPDLTPEEIALLSRHMMRHPAATTDELHTALVSNRAADGGGQSINASLGKRGQPRVRKPPKNVRPTLRKPANPDDSQ